MPETDGVNPSLIHVRTSSSEPLRDCERRFSEIEGDVKEIKTILVGADGRDGLVADLNQVLYRNRYVAFIGQALVSIIVTVITAYILKGAAL